MFAVHLELEGIVHSLHYHLDALLIGGLIRNARKPQQAGARKADKKLLVSPQFIAYLIVVCLLFFVPWGLNYLIAGTITAQIRAWNRLTPIILLLFLLGAAAIIEAMSMPISSRTELTTSSATSQVLQIDRSVSSLHGLSLSASPCWAHPDQQEDQVSQEIGDFVAWVAASQEHGCL